jgi:hypothetical protein
MTWREFPKWIDGPDGPVIVMSIEEEHAIIGVAAAGNNEISARSERTFCQAAGA